MTTSVKEDDLIVRVAISTPIRKLFDYRLPPDLLPDQSLSEAGAPRADLAGRRVEIPFGRKSRCIGIIVAITDHTEVPDHRLKPVERLIDDVPILPANSLKLLIWAANYYHYPIGEAILQSLPPSVKQGKPLQPAERNQLYVRTGKSVSTLRANATRLHALCELIGNFPYGISFTTLRQNGFTEKQIQSLLEQHLITEQPPKPDETPTRKSTTRLNEEQRLANEKIRANFHHFQTFLLQGVTGSGKTEVYLEATMEAVNRGMQVLVLVPEINLTPQTLHRFRALFGDKAVAVHHSALAEGEKNRNWRRMLMGETMVLIGTRSALFYPFQRLGLIVVDEEHDTSYKQMSGLRYSARDLAIKLGSLHHCPVLLGSATPSLDSLHNVSVGKYQLLTLSQRHGEARPPKVHLIDLRAGATENGVSLRILEEARKHLSANRQVLFFINRKGYAPALLCDDCGWIAGCHHCDTRLTYYQARQTLQCHHCGRSYQVIRFCPVCKSQQVHPSGQGTEQVEELLNRHFEEFPVLRIDRESMSGQRKLDNTLNQIRSNQPCLLVGTQILAKGHDFPRLSMVAILAADDGFYSSDFRASERTVQLIIQVAGRAGRAAIPGEVFIQTRTPDMHLLQMTCRMDYPAIARVLLEERKHCALPPWTASALLVAESQVPERARTLLEDILKTLHTTFDIPEGAGISPPLSPAIQRKADYYRYFVFMQHPNRSLLHQLLCQVEKVIDSIRLPSRTRVFLDVDPIDQQG